MYTDPEESNFQKFLDQKMKEIKDGVIQNIIRKKNQNKQKIANQTKPLNLDDPKIYDMKNPNDAEIVNSKFNKMIEDIRQKINQSTPTLNQLKTQYKF